jgi:hypothetical protein
MPSIADLTASEDINAQTGTTYQPVLSDVFKTYVSLSNANAITVTLPLEATVGFRAATGSRPIHFVWVGDGQPTFVVPEGGTLTPAATPKISAKDKAVSAIPVPGGNEWRLIGSLTA